MAYIPYRISIYLLYGILYIRIPQDLSSKIERSCRFLSVVRDYFLDDETK